MKTIEDKVNFLRNQGFKEYDGRLFLSAGLSYSVGSPVYDNGLITSIDVSAIRDGSVTIDLHFLSNYTGRWETSWVMVRDINRVKEIADNYLGKSIRDVKTSILI